MHDLDAALERSRRAFVEFAASCRVDETSYRLTPAADASVYARCFGVFCRYLARETFAPHERSALAAAIRDAARALRRENGTARRGKPLRQLLAFSLSALAALGVLADDPLEDLTVEQVPENVRAALDDVGALQGRPGSGNHAMFIAVALLHARDYLGRDTGDRIHDWVTLHLAHMNRFGFWGSDAGMTHLQFQNGYHQYEILEFLGVASPRQGESIRAVRQLADAQGHFAPYPGGGGCYDYDAVFLLTPRGTVPDAGTGDLLQRTAATVLSEQRRDGGFAESLGIRPRQIALIRRMLAHVSGGRGNLPLLTERLRYGLALQRRRHDRIHTHGSAYSRRWDESDLWDSWFRMMTVARIHTAFDPSKSSEWGFIDYPGIGYHPAARLRLRPD